MLTDEEPVLAMLDRELKQTLTHVQASNTLISLLLECYDMANACLHQGVDQTHILAVVTATLTLFPELDHLDEST